MPYSHSTALALRAPPLVLPAAVLLPPVTRGIKYTRSAVPQDVEGHTGRT